MMQIRASNDTESLGGALIAAGYTGYEITSLLLDDISSLNFPSSRYHRRRPVIGALTGATQATESLAKYSQRTSRTFRTE